MKSAFYTLFFLVLQVSLHAQVSIQHVAELPEKVSNNAVCEGFINDSAYVFSFGGIDTSKKYNGIHLRSYRYNIKTQKSIRLPDLPDTRGKIAAGASRIRNIIYIAGGYHVFQNGSEISSSKMHRYDIKNNVFLDDAQDIPVATDDHVQAVWRDSLIYIVTGWSDSRNIPNVQVYDPSSDNWMVGTSIPNNHNYKSFGASGTILNDTIYYFGGASSASGFSIQNQLRKGVIDPSNPTHISWSITTPNPIINGYRMAATHVGKGLYWIGGSTTTYNFDGIAYNGTGGVSPANRILYTSTDNIQWNEEFKNEIPMDLRGIAIINDSTQYLVGGMNTMQEVTNKIYKIEFQNALANLESKESINSNFTINPNPFSRNLTIKNNTSTMVIMRLYSSTGKQIIEQTLLPDENEISLNSISDGLYFVEIIYSNTRIMKKLIKRGS